MKAIDFLKNKGITKATCYTDVGTYYVGELAKLMEEYSAFSQPPVSGRSEQLLAFAEFIDKDLIDNVPPKEIVEKFLSQ